MNVTTLRTEYPCCHGLSVIRAVAHVPRETYERQCPRCGKAWTVRRTLLRPLPVRMDKLEWEPVL